MTQAINSGQINQTSFPGAEDGLTLIELIGTVSVTGTLSSLSLRKVASASTTASSSTSAGIVLKYLPLASTTAAAITSASELRNTNFELSPAMAKCTASASLVVKFQATAETVGSAEVLVDSYVAATNGASTTAEAAVTAINAQNVVSRTAVLQARATTSAYAVRGIPFSGQTNPTGYGLARFHFIRQLDASVIAKADTGADAMLKKAASGSVTPTADTMVDAVLYRRVSIHSTPTAVVKPANGALWMATSGQTTPRASGTASFRFNLTATAETTAQALGVSVAADYGIAMPAPAERTMVVQGSTRLMEVPTWY